MAWSAPSADRPLPNEGALRYGMAWAALPLWAPFLAAAGAGMAWWWATAWTRRPDVFAPAPAPTRRIEVTGPPETVSPAPAPTRRIEVSGAPEAVSPAPAPKTVAPVLEPPADAAEVAADVHAVAALETAPLHSDAEAVKAAVAEVVAAAARAPGGDGPKPARRKSIGPKATV